MKDYISRIHYITQDMPDRTHQQLALEACQAGVDLVQLRLKNMEKSEMLKIARETQKICNRYRATLIINDHLNIALEIDADGIHLGNGDLDHEIARKELGEDKILGGTAYNEIEAEFHQSKGIVDYIGLGTFRQTRTKPEIKDFLSLQEIGQLITRLQQVQGRTIPLLVIGGIRIADIAPLLEVGVHGIAIASLINESSDKASIFKSIQQAFNHADQLQQ